MAVTKATMRDRMPGGMRGKKGVFLTIIILVVISIVLVSSLFYVSVYQRKSVERRILTMNQFIASAEEDLRRNLYIAAFRSLFIFEKSITESGTYLASTNASFNELFFNGTFAGVPQDLMLGATYADVSSGLQQTASKISTQLSFSGVSVALQQSDPWHVNATLSGRLFLQDSAGLASWNTTLVISTLVPIATFEDPLYLIGTGGKVAHPFVQTPYTVFAQGTDVTNLTSHLDKNYYKTSSSAPSFLGRFEGSAAASSYGIESLVELIELSAQGIPVETKSVVDYIYFSASNPSSHQIQGMPSWFRLDDAHLDAYDVGGLVIP